MFAYITDKDTYTYIYKQTVYLFSDQMCLKLCN